MIYFRSFCFFIWFSVYLTLIDVAITNADVGNLETLPSTAGASTGLKRNNMSIHAVQKKDYFRRRVCNSNACVDTALEMKQFMNNHVDPCEDFYKFSCDGFIKSLPKSLEYLDVNSVLNGIRIEQLRNIIQEESPPNEPRSHKLARNFYKACMKESTSLTDGIESLHRNFKEMGGWPVLEGDRWNESDFHWADSISKFRKLGYSFNYFIKFGVINYKPSNASIHRLYLAPPTFGFPRDDLIKGFSNEAVQKYYNYMVDMAVFIGADRDQAKLELYESLKFEIELARISSKNTRRLIKYNEITLDGLKTYYESSVEWLQELNIILAPQVQLKKDDIIIETVPFYLSDMGELINKTSKRVLANYAFWRAYNDVADYINKPGVIRFTKIRFYDRQMLREKELKWSKCVRLVSDHLDFSVISMELNEDARKTVVEIGSNIKQAFKQILEEVKWMDKKTRKRALKKLQNLKSFISYPNKYVNITRLDKFYKDLELSPDNFFENKLNMTRFETNRMFDLLNEQPKGNEWWRFYLKPMRIISAISEQRKNSIIIPAGLLQKPFLYINEPNYMNYGSIGSTIGREITNGFTANGRYYYKKDEMISWWEPSTLKKYQQEEDCLILFYGKYRDKYTGMNLNGLRTLNENSADMGGVKAAYYAYQKWVQHNGQEDALPGLPYTPNQLFWISYAHQWCGKFNRKTMQRWLTNGATSPSKYRVNAVLSNMEEFSQDFKCKNSSKMNSSWKCPMW